jgi:hypothetical protein
MYVIETAQGFVKAIRTVAGELNEVTAYTNDKTLARQFTKKQLTAMCVRSFFRYHSIKITITEV